MSALKNLDKGIYMDCQMLFHAQTVRFLRFIARYNADRLSGAQKAGIEHYCHIIQELAQKVRLLIEDKKNSWDAKILPLLQEINEHLDTMEQIMDGKMIQ